MGRRGPPPTPTRVKKLRGNPGRRPLGEDAEPQPRPSSAEPEKDLSAEAKRVWRRLAPELLRVGVLTEVDRLEFGRLCELVVMVKDLRRQLKAEGFTIVAEVTGRDGSKGERTRKHPVADLLHQTETRLTTLSDRFGLTLSGRVKIPVTPAPVSDEDKLLKYTSRSA
jgi:P27 family predicted phage terminase small subunit